MKDQIITKKILNWYDLNKRKLPWRKNVSQSKKHYYTLVSEFMLQQTQVVTVIPYFNRFINKIPNLKKLSIIQNRELIKLWEGLGYYSRARNLKKTAKIIIGKYHGKIPNNYDDLIPLVKRKVKAIICLGKQNKNLIDIFSKCTELIISTDNMSDAVNSAYKVSKPGDVVLLSPACSSFDLFDSYEDRGNKFKEEVRKL